VLTVLPRPISVFLRRGLKIFVGPFRIANCGMTFKALWSSNEVKKCFLGSKRRCHFMPGRHFESAHDLAMGRVVRCWRSFLARTSYANRTAISQLQSLDTSRMDPKLEQAACSCRLIGGFLTDVARRQANATTHRGMELVMALAY
jgi:hypothetical protein